MTKHFLGRIIFGVLVLGFLASACSGGAGKSSFAGTRGAASQSTRDKATLWLAAREECLDGEGHPLPEKFVGATGLEAGQGLCVSDPDDHFRTSNGILEIAGVVNPHDRNLTGITVHVERVGASCSGSATDAENGCATVNIETFGDIDEDGAFATTAPLYQPGIYTVTIQASFNFVATGTGANVRVERTVYREAAPSISLQSLGNDGHTPPNSVYLCPSRFENEYNLKMRPCDEEESPFQKLHADTLNFCVLVDDQTCPEGPGTCAVGATVKGAVFSSRDSSGWQFKQDFQATNPCSGMVGGRSVTVPVGHGRNEIELSVENSATAADPGSIPMIRIREFQNDRQGPQLCVTYLDGTGRTLGYKNGESIDPSTLAGQDIIVDLAFGACPANPASNLSQASDSCLKDSADDRREVCQMDDPATLDTIEGANTACIQKSNRLDEDGEPLFTKMCPVAANGHYQYRLGKQNLDFPINTFSLVAADEWGNKTEETQSFGLGAIHPLLDGDGELKLEQLSQVLSLFVSQPFLEGDGVSDLRNMIEEMANTDKFKHEVFLKIFDPIVPAESELSCIGNPSDPFDDTSKEKIKTFKLHPLTDSQEFPTIGHISVPYIFLLSDDRIQVGLKIKRLAARADVFTMAFDDTDGDHVDDLDGDIDDDDDGLCDDKDVTVSTDGETRCRPALDREGKEIDDPYDNKRNKDYKDFLRGGHIIAGDECLGVDPLPITLDLRDLELNLEIKFNRKNGRYSFKVQKILNRVPLVRFKGEDDDPGNTVKFDCERERLLTADEDGVFQNTNADQCQRLRRLEKKNNNYGTAPTCQNQKLWQQLQFTLENMLTCNMPSRITETLDQYQSNRLQQMSINLLGKNITVDVFSDLLGGDLKIIPPGDPVSTWGGLGLSTPGLILPAGIVDEGEESETDARHFFNTLLPRLREAGVSLNQFGPLYQPSLSASRVQSPINLLRNFKRDVSAAFSEEALNMALHTVNTLLFDVDQKDPRFLDIGAARVRKDFDLPVFSPEPNAEGAPGKICLDKYGDTVAEEDCLTIGLNIEEFFGDVFQWIDFDGDGMANSDWDKVTPLSFHLSVNPKLGITAKLGSVSSSQGRFIAGEFEVGLSNAVLSFYEEDAAGEKLSWCRQDVGVSDLATCQRSPREEDKKPFARFLVSGKLTYVAVLDTRANADDEYLLSLGLIPEDSRAITKQADVERSYLKLSLLENNTLFSDETLSRTVNDRVFSKVAATLVYGSAQSTQIKVPRHLMQKLQEVANEDREEALQLGDPVPESVLDTEELLQDLNDFGFSEIGLQSPVFTVGQAVPRQMGFGLDLEFSFR